jgi:hypothetical protein
VVKPSTAWPFQRFSWTDHDANIGDTVSYRAIPVIRNATGKLEILEAQGSDWSPSKTLGTTTGKFKPFFNRGFDEAVCVTAPTRLYPIGQRAGVYGQGGSGVVKSSRSQNALH